MDRLHEWALKDPQRTVLIGDRQSLTYGELDLRANAIAEWFIALGLGEGSTIALLLANEPRVVQFWWGARRAGLYYVPVSTQLTRDEVAFILRDSGTEALVAGVAYADLATSLLDVLDPQAIRYKIAVDGEIPGFIAYEPSVSSMSGKAELPQRPVGREFIYSSGTTGKPKGVRRALSPYSKRNELPAVEIAIRRIFKTCESMVYLSVSPLYHATGRFINRVIESGGTCVILTRFDPEVALGAIDRYKVTHTQWVPTMFVRLLALPSQVRRQYDVSTLALALHSAAPCPERVKRQMIEWWGPIVDEYYGGTENVGITFIDSREWLEHPGSVGRAFVGEIHILSDDGSEAELSANNIGLVYFSGGLSFTYHNDEQKSQQAFSSQGWGSYGDIGHVDADGYLYLSDRRTDLIVCGGVNIYPKEIEDVMSRHEAVKEVAVIGVPNEEYGQEVKAVVVLQLGTTSSAGLATEMIQHCRNHLSKFKCPRSVNFISELPRSENGKLLKRALRDMYRT